MHLRLAALAGLAGLWLFSNEARGIDRTCRALLKDREPNDPFEGTGLACPFETVGELPDRACRNNMDKGDVITPTSLSEANRLPDYEFPEMVLGDFRQHCSDIFESSEFVRLLEGVQPISETDGQRLYPKLPVPATDVQRRLATVFAHLSWGYCHKISRGLNYVEHAIFNQETRNIVLYATACEASNIYGMKLDPLNIGHRYALVSAHELGHAIDAAAGRSLDRPTAEDSATLVGTYFAQCFGRVVRKLLADASDLDARPEQTRLRQAIFRRYDCFEKEVLELRDQVKKWIKKPRNLKKTTKADGTFSCVTFTNNVTGETQ